MQFCKATSVFGEDTPQDAARRWVIALTNGEGVRLRWAMSPTNLLVSNFEGEQDAAFIQLQRKLKAVKVAAYSYITVYLRFAAHTPAELADVHALDALGRALYGQDVLHLLENGGDVTLSLATARPFLRCICS